MDKLSTNPEGHSDETVNIPSNLEPPKNDQQNPSDCTHDKEEKFDVLNSKLTRAQVGIDNLFFAK